MTDKIYIQNRPPKSPAAAGILSVIPGVGQFYNGEKSKGLLFLFIFAGLISMMPRGPHPFLPLIFAGFYIYQIIDAVQTAKAINLKALGETAAAAGIDAPAAACPPAPAKPEPQGSIFWGLLLMSIGAIFLLANFNLLSIERILDFWPVAVIVIGLKIVYDSLRKND
jgi:hypothetical protein